MELGNGMEIAWKLCGNGMEASRNRPPYTRDVILQS